MENLLNLRFTPACAHTARTHTVRTVAKHHTRAHAQPGKQTRIKRTNQLTLRLSPPHAMKQNTISPSWNTRTSRPRVHATFAPGSQMTGCHGTPPPTVSSDAAPSSDWTAFTDSLLLTTITNSFMSNSPCCCPQNASKSPAVPACKKTSAKEGGAVVRSKATPPVTRSNNPGSEMKQKPSTIPPLSSMPPHVLSYVKTTRSAPRKRANRSRFSIQSPPPMRAMYP
eukprot:992354-Rhodomonas_salina.1